MFLQLDTGLIQHAEDEAQRDPRCTARIRCFRQILGGGKLRENQPLPKTWRRKVKVDRMLVVRMGPSTVDSDTEEQTVILQALSLDPPSEKGRVHPRLAVPTLIATCWSLH